MSLCHAANRFRRTTIDGWNGTAWSTNIAKVSLPVSHDISTGPIIRVMLTDPSSSIASNITAVRFFGDIYMVGQSERVMAGSTYQISTTIRKAQDTAKVYGFTSTTAASGLKSKPVRTLTATHPCDLGPVTIQQSTEYPTVRFENRSIVFPKGTPITTNNELEIDDHVYEISNVWEEAGMTYCSGISRPKEA